jgi:hypothetical protein
MTTPPYDVSPTTGRPERVAPRSAVVAAHLVPLVVLPSGVWRVLLGCGVSMGFNRATLEAEGFPGRGTVMVVGLTLLTEALALLTLGLVRPWGETFPRWLPLVDGRRVPASPVVALASTGGLALTAMWTFALRNALLNDGLDEISSGAWHAVAVACYLPALAWGPLLLHVTWLYHRRRAASARRERVPARL